MSSEPKVSIIIPVYNVQSDLDRCLSSVVVQTLKELEIILVDDGSTDESGELCDAWAEKDPRIRVIHKKNGGLRSAIVAGVNAATAVYCAFVDSDDYVSPLWVQAMYEPMVRMRADCVQCGYIFHTAAGEDRVIDCPESIKSKEQIHKILTDCFEKKGMLNVAEWSNPRWCKLYRTELYRRLEPLYYPGVSMGEDVETQLLYLPLCEKVATISHACYYYYAYSDGSMSKNISRAGEAAQRRGREAMRHAAEIYGCGMQGLARAEADLNRWFYLVIRKSDIPESEKSERLRALRAKIPNFHFWILKTELENKIQKLQKMLKQKR